METIERKTKILDLKNHMAAGFGISKTKWGKMPNDERIELYKTGFQAHMNWNRFEELMNEVFK